MKMYCPFCKGGISFDKQDEGESSTCPNCDHVILLKHLTGWNELKYDFKQFANSIDAGLQKGFGWAGKHWKALVWTFGIIGFLSIGYWSGSMFFFSVGGFGILFVAGGLLAWIVTRLVAQEVKPPPYFPPPPFIEPPPVIPLSTQYASGSNIDQSQTHTIIFNITGEVPIVKCAHCGTPRPKQILSCLSCGSTNVE